MDFKNKKKNVVEFNLNPKNLDKKQLAGEDSTPLDVAVAHLAQACCACVVTSLPGTGASLALKYRKSGSSGNGKTKVYLLAKGSRSGRELVVDVKCMDASAVDSARIVADVVHALSSLSL